MFALEKVTNHEFVCVTEGPLDTMWLWQNGYPSVAIFGANLSHTQIQLLSKIRTPELVLAFDNDDTGRKITKYAQEKLGDRFKISILDLKNYGKDVQEIRNPEIIRDIMERRTTDIARIYEQNE